MTSGILNVYRHHLNAIKSGLASCIDTGNQPIQLYSNHGLMREARKVFDEIPHITHASSLLKHGSFRPSHSVTDGIEINATLSWNFITEEYAHNDSMETVLDFFGNMVEKGVNYNHHTLKSVLGASTSLNRLKLANSIHVLLLINDATSYEFLSGFIVDLYAKCGQIKYAGSVYAKMRNQTPFVVASLIANSRVLVHVNAAQKKKTNECNIGIILRTERSHYLTGVIQKIGVYEEIMDADGIAGLVALLYCREIGCKDMRVYSDSQNIIDLINCKDSKTVRNSRIVSPINQH